MKTARLTADQHTALHADLAAGWHDAGIAYRYGVQPKAVAYHRTRCSIVRHGAHGSADLWLPPLVHAEVHRAVETQTDAEVMDRYDLTWAEARYHRLGHCGFSLDAV